MVTAPAVLCKVCIAHSNTLFVSTEDIRCPFVASAGPPYLRESGGSTVQRLLYDLHVLGCKCVQMHSISVTTSGPVHFLSASTHSRHPEKRGRLVGSRRCMRALAAQVAPPGGQLELALLALIISMCIKGCENYRKQNSSPPQVPDSNPPTMF